MFQLTLLLSLLTSAVVGIDGFTSLCFNPFPPLHIKNPKGFYSLNFTATDEVTLLVYPKGIQNTNIPPETAMIPFDHDPYTSWNGTFKLCIEEDADCLFSDLWKFHVEWYNDEDTSAKGDHAGDSAVQSHKQDLERLRAKQEKKVLNIFLRAGEQVVYELPEYGTYCYIYYDYYNRWNDRSKQEQSTTLEYRFHKSFAGLSYENYTKLMSSIASLIISIGLGLYIRYYVLSKATKTIDKRALIPFMVFLKLLTLDVVNKTLQASILLYHHSYEVYQRSTDDVVLNLLQSICQFIEILKLNLIYQFVAFNKPNILTFNNASQHKITIMILGTMLCSRIILIYDLYFSSISKSIKTRALFIYANVRVGYLLQCYWKSQITEHTIVNNQKKYARCFKITRIVIIPLLPILKLTSALLKIGLTALVLLVQNSKDVIGDDVEEMLHPLMKLFHLTFGSIIMFLSNLELFRYPILIAISLKIWRPVLLEDATNTFDETEMDHMPLEGSHLD